MKEASTSPATVATTATVTAMTSIPSRLRARCFAVAAGMMTSDRHEQDAQVAQPERDREGEGEQVQELDARHADPGRPRDVARDQRDDEAAALREHERHHRGRAGDPEGQLPAAERAGGAEERVHQLVSGREHASHRERHREHDAGHRLRGDPGLLLEPPDQERPGEQRQQAAQDRVEVEREGEPDPRERDVGHGVGRERHAAHHGEAADDPRGDGHRYREGERAPLHQW